MGLDPHGDRLFLLHLLEVYGYDTLLVSEQLCCSWETTDGWLFRLSSLLALKRGGLSFESCTTGFSESPGPFEPPEVSLVLLFFFGSVSPCASFVHSGSAPSPPGGKSNNWSQAVSSASDQHTLKMDCSPLTDQSEALNRIRLRYFNTETVLNATDGGSKPWMMCSKGLLRSGSQWCGDFQRTKSVLYESVKQREPSCR